MRSLFLLLIVLAGCSCLRAQKINLSPQEAAGYLANLHVTENRKFINDGTDSLNTIYENAVVSSDTAQMIHAQGWLAYSYYSTRQMQEAIGLARASKALAAEFGMPSTARALAASTLVLAVTNPSTSARAAELKDALTGCVPDSRLEYEVKVMLVHTISAVCAPEVDSLLESLLPFINNGYESLKESRMYQSYYAVKAYYYERCTGDLEQAEVMRRRVMNYYKESKGNRSHFMLYTDAIIRTAALNSRMDRRPEVEELVAVLDTIDLQETAYNGIAYINMVNALNNVYLYLGMYAKAEQMILDFLDYAEKNKEQVSSKIYTIAYQELRSVYYDWGKYEKAWDVHQLELKNTPGFSPFHEIYSIKLPSALDQPATAIDSARSHLQQVCTDCAPGQLPTLRNELRPGDYMYNNIGEAYRLLGVNTYFLAARRAAPDLEGMRAGAELVAQGEPFLEKSYNTVAATDEGIYSGGGSLQEQNRVLGNILAHIAVHTDNKEDHAAAFLAIENGKANGLKSDMATTGLPAEQLAINARLKKEMDQLEVLSQQAEGPERDALRISFLAKSEEYRNFIITTREAYGERLKKTFSERSVRLPALQKKLGKHEVFLNYSLARLEQKRYLVVQAITQDDIKTHRQEVGDDFEAGVEELKKLLQSPLQLQSSKRKRLAELTAEYYEFLIRPVAGRLRAGMTLAVCPSNELSLLPFEVLRPSGEDLPYQDAPFLLRDYRINYHYSATALVNSRTTTVTSTSVFAFAPVFDDGALARQSKHVFRSIPDSLITGLRDGVIDPLPATEGEVKGLISEYSGNNSVALLRKEATKEALFSRLAQPARVVHLATHGYVNERNNDLSALACYGASGEGDLIFASEIRNLRLNADIVILSSCESGIGRKVDGEGVLSLNRAFVRAGARNVLSTFWKIDDRYSSKLMVKFHEEVAAGQSYTEALRLAKLELLKDPKTALPRFWAPFVLVGE